MTRLRIASLFVAVVAGDYAALMLIDGQLINFGVAAAICAGSSVAAGLIAYADDEDARRQHELGRRRRTAGTRRRAAIWGSSRPSPKAARARQTRRDPLRAGAVVEVIQDDPSMAGRIAWLSARLMIRPTLIVGSFLPSAPWPWGLVEFAARAIAPTPGMVRVGIGLPHCTAQLVRAAGVLPADGTRPVVLYLHGGAFLTRGPYSHGRLVSTLARFAG